jgi:hypothetical protein
MRSTIRRGLLLTGACLIFGPHLWGQQFGSDSQARLEVAVLYSPLLSNVARANRFWMQGGSIQVEGQFWRGLGIEADISGFHAQNASNTGVGLDMVTTTFGPRYRWSSAHQRYSFFGHALLGEANGFNSIFPGADAASATANSSLVAAWTCQSSIILRCASSRPTGCAHNCPTRTPTSKTIFVWLPESSSGFAER